MRKLLFCIVNVLLICFLGGCTDKEKQITTEESKVFQESEEKMIVEVEENKEIEEKLIVDYEDAFDLEDALNNGEADKMVGKIVRFEVIKNYPEPACGYLLYAGNHLNFLSVEKQIVIAGDKVIGKITKVDCAETEEYNQWLIQYERIIDENWVDMETIYNRKADFNSAEELEAAMNAGNDVRGKTALIRVNDFMPTSALGYNIWAGEHLNIVSFTHPGISVEEEIKIFVVDVLKLFNESWEIYYIPIFSENEKLLSYKTQYEDLTEFETDLNEGEYLQDVEVKVKVKSVHPDSAFGFDLWAGEHLNFIIDADDSITEGDIITVKTTIIGQVMGSWIIYGEVIDNE